MIPKALPFLEHTVVGTTSLIVLTESSFIAWLEKQSVRIANWCQSNAFEAKPASVCLVPDETGNLEKILVGVDEAQKVTSISHLPLNLPEGQYHLETIPAQYDTSLLYLSFALGAYQFTHYKSAKRLPAQLVCDLEAKMHQKLLAECEAIYWVRDLINLPAEDMGPVQLSEAANTLALKHGASFNVIEGESLLENNFPAIHAVGRAGHQAPRLIELNWGSKNHPKITLVGKGVCFDSGGLDIKTASGMRTMKKDMGGAAHILGLAHYIMSVKLPIQLQVLIPAVENVIAANAYKPGDILQTRSGLTVEVGNTDAEGRVVLADALTYAKEFHPELIIDMATLTGAARIALGTDLPACFTNDLSLGRNLQDLSEEVSDPIWPMPLFSPYDALIDSKLADVSNTGSSVYGGAITAALFLKRFLNAEKAYEGDWLHFDIMAYNQSSSPGKPEGGEAMGLRTLAAYLSLCCGS